MAFNEKASSIVPEKAMNTLIDLDPGHQIYRQCK